jgi:hypothetical protein
MKSPLTKQDLKPFTGTPRRYRHRINHKVHFTEGAKCIADRAEAYWLLDEIALIQPFVERISSEALQVWKLKVNADRSGQLICEDGNQNVLYTKEVPLTALPGEDIALWFTDNTILIPSEYWT